MKKNETESQGATETDARPGRPGPEPADSPVDDPGRAGAPDAGEVAEELHVADLDRLSAEELRSRLHVAAAEIERLQDQVLRRQAELINYRRRVQKERADLVTVAQADLLEGLVPVIDDFERAVEAKASDAEAYHEGMELILRSVQAVLERLGVERIEPRGEPFDPRVHEAIARQPTDEVAEGVVIDVYQAGYMLKDRLIRPASVVVAYRDGSGDSPASAADEADAEESTAGGRQAGGTDA